MDTTSLTKRLKIEIDGCPSFGGKKVNATDSLFKVAVEWKSSREDVIGFFVTNQSVLLLTNYAIYISGEEFEDDIIRWWEITKVSYENEHFMFFNSEGKNFKNINVRTFFPKEIPTSTGVCFSEGLTSVASIAPNPLQLAQENKYSEAIEAVNYYITIESSIELYVTRAFIYYDRAIKSNDNKNLLQEALTEIEKTIDHCKDHEECWKLHKYKGHILELMDKITDSRNAYMRSLAEAPEEQKYKLQNMIREFEEANADLWDNYILRVPYKERKYIMLVEDSKIKKLCYFRNHNIQFFECS